MAGRQPRLTQAMLDSATEKYAVGAYLHHFQKYGVGADVFEDSFAVLQRVIDDYETPGATWPLGGQGAVLVSAW